MRQTSIKQELSRKLSLRQDDKKKENEEAENGDANEDEIRTIERTNTITITEENVSYKLHNISIGLNCDQWILKALRYHW